MREFSSIPENEGSVVHYWTFAEAALRSVRDACRRARVISTGCPLWHDVIMGGDERDFTRPRRRRAADTKFSHHLY
jgi:hypothetical protein